MTDRDPLGLPRVLEWWHQRDTEPLLSVRCVVRTGSKTCGNELGAVYRCPAGLLLLAYCDIPPRRIGVPGDVTPEMLALYQHARQHGPSSRSPTGRRKKGALVSDSVAQTLRWEPGSAEALEVADIDDQGTVVMLDHLDYWHRPWFSCRVHGGIAADRAQLMEAIRRKETVHPVQPPQR